MESVQNICKRLLLLTNGVVKFDGDVEKGITEYLSGYKLGEYTLKSSLPLVGKGFTINKIYTSIKEDSKKLWSDAILGQPYFFYLDYVSELKGTSIAVRIQIFDERNELIATFSNYHSEKKTCRIKEAGQITLYIEKLPLPHGVYRIGIKILNLLTKESLIEIENLANFNVENGDFFNTGKLPLGTNLGKVLIEHKWFIK